MSPPAPELKERFLDLACQLSPENLSCDGELPRAEREARRRRILVEWEALEKEAGRPVPLQEAESWLWAPGPDPEMPSP